MPRHTFADVIFGFRFFALPVAIDNALIHIFIVGNKDQCAVFFEERHAIVVVAYGKRLALCSSACRRIEREAIGPQGISPHADNVPLIAGRHRNGIAAVCLNLFEVLS